MKVFISWSKLTSHKFALILHDWLPEVIQEIQPWMSSEDIDKGQRWVSEVGAKLGELDQGILCVTPDNVHEAWLNFEAGALAKSLDEARVRPILLGLQASEVVGPLAQLQATIATDRSDMLKFVNSLNSACARPLDSARLTRTFERNWGDYMMKLKASMSLSVRVQNPQRRSSEDMLGELLERMRDMQRALEGRPGRPLELHPGLGDVRLGDGSAPKRGMSIRLPDGRSGQVASVLVPTPTLASAYDGVVNVNIDGGGEILERASNLHQWNGDDPMSVQPATQEVNEE